MPASSEIVDDAVVGPATMPPLPAVVSRASVPAPLAATQASEGDGETELCREPAKPSDEKKRPSWKGPVVVIGAAVPILILMWFFGYLAWPHVRAHPRGSGAAEREPTPEEQEHWRALVGYYVQAHIKVTYKSMGKFDKVNVSEAEVEAAPRDPRKIPWLWVATASVAITPKPEEPGRSPETIPFIWKSLYLWVPEGPRGECWREVTFTNTGRKSHKHFEISEWKPEFRSYVAREWLQAFKQYENRPREQFPPSDYEAALAIKAEKMKLADSIGISIEEFDEILQTPE
jgi:hypothetical protein